MLKVVTAFHLVEKILEFLNSYPGVDLGNKLVQLLLPNIIHFQGKRLLHATIFRDVQQRKRNLERT